MNLMRRLLISAALAVCVVGWSCGSKSQQQPSPPGSEAGKAQSTLSVEAGLVYKSGDVKPVPRNEFYLLDDDAEKILRDAGIEKKGRLRRWKEVSFVNSYAAAKLCVRG